MTIIRLLLGVFVGGAIGAVLGYLGKRSPVTSPLAAHPLRAALYGAVVGALLVSAWLVLLQKGATSSDHESALPRETMITPEDTAAKPAEESRKFGVVHIDNRSDFEAKVLRASGICLVDLFSDRCPPCRMLAPTISSLADKYAGKVTVCKVNLDRVPAIAQEYGVMAIPTVLILKDGQEVRRLIGLRPESEYAAQLEQLIN